VSVDPRRLRGRDAYERAMQGTVHNTHDDALTHVVRLEEPERALELEVVATPSPGYEIREARCVAIRGDVAPALTSAAATLAGTAMVGGLTRRAAAAFGDVAGAALAVDALIEVARLARQVAKMPPERARRAAGGDSWECWQLDMSGWIDLPDSCFTYSEAGRALFGTRAIASPMQPELYSPRPGQRDVFQRRKHARLERRGERVRLFHSMHDNVHGFELTCVIDLATATILQAEHVTPRLPYTGVCSEPQRRFASLVGERVDGDLRRRLQTSLGGPTGCAQLYDLTADLLKLLA
jgi:DUF2889 family protein